MHLFSSNISHSSSISPSARRRQEMIAAFMLGLAALNCFAAKTVMFHSSSRLLAVVALATMSFESMERVESAISRAPDTKSFSSSSTASLKYFAYSAFPHLERESPVIVDGVYATLVLYFSESVSLIGGVDLQEGLIAKDDEARGRPIFRLSRAQRVLLSLSISFRTGSGSGSSNSMLFWAKRFRFPFIAVRV